LPESFREIVKGYAVERAVRVLRDAGLLVPEDGRLKKRSPHLPSLGRIRCYVLHMQEDDE